MPGDIQWQVFAYIVSEVETPLIAATTQVFNAFISYVQTPLKLALILYVALTGILFIRGEASEPGSVVISRGIKFAIIVWLLTGSGLYQQWVYNFFFVSLPNGLSQSLTSTGAAGAVSANSFDDGWIKSWRAGLEVWNRTSWDDVATQLGVLLFWVAAVLSNVFCFAIWLISRIILAVYIAVGPLLIPLILFPATRGFFERWIGALISCVILQITTIVLLYIILLAENQVLAKVVTTSKGGDSIEGLQVLLSGVVFFAVAAFVAVQLPGVASSLSGGLSFHTGAVVRGMQKAMGGTGSTSTDAAGNTTRSGRSGIIGGAHYGASLAGRGIAAGARGIRQAIRPTTGGSLSDRGGRRPVPQRQDSAQSKEQTMIRRVVLLLLPLAVSACAGGHPPLAEASGSYRALNAGKWVPTRDDLRGPRQPLAPVDSPSLNPVPAVLTDPAAPAAPGGQGA